MLGKVEEGYTVNRRLITKEELNRFEKKWLKTGAFGEQEETVINLLSEKIIEVVIYYTKYLY